MSFTYRMPVSMLLENITLEDIKWFATFNRLELTGYDRDAHFVALSRLDNLGGKGSKMTYDDAHPFRIEKSRNKANHKTDTQMRAELDKLRASFKYV